MPIKLISFSDCPTSFLYNKLCYNLEQFSVKCYSQIKGFETYMATKNYIYIFFITVLQ